MAASTNIALGDIVKDSISGVEGKVIATIDWLYGCRRLVLQPLGIDKDGKPWEQLTIDEPQASLVEPEGLPAAAPRHGGRDDTASLRR